jgi:hypothetical protein
MPDASPELTGIRAIKYNVVAYKSVTKVNFIHQPLDSTRLIPHQILIILSTSTELMTDVKL